MGIDLGEVSKKTKKHKRGKSRVAFEEELINKGEATKMLAKFQEPSDHEIIENTNKKVKSEKKIGDIEDRNIECGINGEIDKKEKKLKKKIKKPSNESENGEQKKSHKNKRKIVDTEDQESEKKSSKKKKLVKTEDNQNSTEHNEEESVKPGKTEESIRAKKRKKHQQLMEARKNKAEIATQENVLNYLSKWKHAKDQWKFEKLKQIWLSENLFDSSKIPDEIWETTVEYFVGSRGFIRNLILRDALKIIEQEDKAEGENVEEEYQSKIKRARDIIQSLQE